MKRNGDWVAWALQFVAGMIAGGILGFAMVLKTASGRSRLLADDQTSTFLWGLALIGGALAGAFGDRLWLGERYQILDPDEPNLNLPMRVVNWTIAAVGTLLCLSALLGSRG
jgi:hypothetical protein